MMPVNMTGYPVVRKTAQHAAALAELDFAMYRWKYGNLLVDRRLSAEGV
jgi:hypothetical protein